MPEGPENVWWREDLEYRVEGVSLFYVSTFTQKDPKDSWRAYVELAVTLCCSPPLSASLKQVGSRRI